MDNLPVGVRFIPSDEELIQHYLRKKVLNQPISRNIIPEVNIYKLDPQKLTDGKYKPLTETEWYFFVCRDHMYSKEGRINRATPTGSWKQGGVEKPIFAESKEPVGFRKSFDFIQKKNGQGRRTEWKMHEYRIHDNISSLNKENERAWLKLDDWVLCRIYTRR